MSAINPNALSKYVGILEVAPYGTSSWARLASVRALILNFDTSANMVEVNADDTGTVFKGYLPEARIEGTFLENADRDTMEMILGGVSSNIAGVLVNVTGEILLDHPAIASWATDQVIWFANYNGDKTIVTNIVIDHNAVPLVEGTDYEVVWDVVANRTGVVRIGAALPLTGDIDADYDYTPNATEKLDLSITFTESERLAIRITATSGVNTRRVTIDDVTFEGIYGLEFLDVVEAGDLTGTAFTFKAAKAAIVTYENQIIL